MIAHNNNLNDAAVYSFAPLAVSALSKDNAQNKVATMNMLIKTMKCHAPGSNGDADSASKYDDAREAQ